MEWNWNPCHLKEINLQQMFEPGTLMGPAEARLPPGWLLLSSLPQMQIWFDLGLGQNSQWANWNCLGGSKERSNTLYYLYREQYIEVLTLWINTWKTQQRLAGYRPLWGQAMWQDLWN